MGRMACYEDGDEDNAENGLFPIKYPAAETFSTGFHKAKLIRFVPVSTRSAERSADATHP